MKNEQAFTLIELLVVVLIIGILAAVALPQYQKAVEKSKATQAFVTLKSVQQAFEAYRLANGEYPTKFEDTAISLPSMTGHVAQIPASDNNTPDTISDKDWSSYDVPYIREIPRGPVYVTVYIISQARMGRKNYVRGTYCWG